MQTRVPQAWKDFSLWLWAPLGSPIPTRRTLDGWVGGYLRGDIDQDKGHKCSFKSR